MPAPNGYQREFQLKQAKSTVSSFFSRFRAALFLSCNEISKTSFDWSAPPDGRESLPLPALKRQVRSYMYESSWIGLCDMACRASAKAFGEAASRHQERMCNCTDLPAHLHST